MPKSLWIVVLVTVAAPWVAGRLGLFAGKRPPDLGLHDGRLKAVPATPNAVSSQASDPARGVAAIAFTGDAKAAFERATAVVLSLPGAKLVVVRPGYLHAEVATRWLRFVDDLELALDPARSVIDVRSASRLGHSDLGVNRARVESLRARFAGRG